MATPPPITTSNTASPTPTGPAALPAAIQGLVASPLLPGPERQRLQLFFDYLAALRAIADETSLDDEAKIFVLDEVERALLGTPSAERPYANALTLPAFNLADDLATNLTDPQWALRLLQTARRDVARSTCPTWSDLMLYCRYAAEPLGRQTLALYGIRNADIDRATDALTASLLVLRLIRRAGRDWQQHGRCFWPSEWFAEEGAIPEHLGELKSNVGVGRVKLRMLERVEKLLLQAAPLPSLLKGTPLATEAQRLLLIARAELKQLRRHDPLARRLKTPALTRWWASLVARWAATP